MIDRNQLPPIYYLRHGETEWNRVRRIQGQTDTPLNETGLSQARRMARKLSQVLDSLDGFQLMASPLQRTRQTMQAVLAVYGKSETDVRLDDRLKELNFGKWEGKSWADIHASGMRPEIEPEKYHDWCPEGGEGYADGRARVTDWLLSVDQPTVVVAHGGISRILRGLVFDLPKREIVALKVPQDRFFRIQDGGLDWFDARDIDA